MSNKPLLIDTDVHNGIKSPTDLLPYLSKVWNSQWLASGTGLGQPYYSPVGVLRKDAVPDDGSTSGSGNGYISQRKSNQSELFAGS
ncbi:MAG TPA: hypothetical protein IAA29_10525 [Candidatus Paenibacillus intestinavium]|nr:hypothetical protein [Candidatus Paenibacillus intestinavium]